MLATDLLNAHLREKGISQRQFAAENGIPKSTIGDICSGRLTDISKATAEILAPVLGRNVAELMGIDLGQIGRGQAATADAGTAGDAAVLIPWAEIAPSPLNPRRSFDEDGIRELADSLWEHGQLQNIVVRRVAFPRPNEDKYHIVAGERRWRATGYNIQVLKRWQADQPMAAKIIEAGDEQHRALALLENLQRVDLTPLEEAEAFKTLTDLKWSTAQIAERIHKTQRFVQQRLSLVTRLVEPARQALAEGKINIEQARALTAGTEKQQKDVLKDIGIEDHGLQTGADIRERLMGGFVPLDRAIFERSLYKGEIRTDEQEREYFVDKKAFKRLQEKAVKDLAATKRQEGWSWVQQAQYFSDYKYEKRRSTDKKKSGVVIVLDWRDEVTVHEGLIKKKDPGSASRASSPQAKAEQEALAQQRSAREAEDKLCGEITERIRAVLGKDNALALRLKLYRAQNVYRDTADCLTWDQWQQLPLEKLVEQIAGDMIETYEFSDYADRADMALLELAGIERPAFVDFQDDLEDELAAQAEEGDSDAGEAEEDAGAD